MSISQPTTNPVSGAAAVAAKITLVSGTLFAVLLLALHLLEPEFDPAWRFISEYALGRFGWIMNLAFVALATSLGACAVAVSAQVRTWYGYTGLAGLGLAAMGTLLAAIFNTDPITTSHDAMSLSGSLHVVGASLDYTPVAALLLSFALARHQVWRPRRPHLFLTALLTVAATVGFILTLPADGVFGPGLISGLTGRAMVLSYLGWLFVVASHVLTLHKSTTQSLRLALAHE